MFWVISVYFNIRNTLPKSGTFLLGHPVYIYIYIYVYIYILVFVTVTQSNLRDMLLCVNYNFNYLSAVHTSLTISQAIKPLNVLTVF